MANQQLFNYLQQHFGKVTILKNGYYFAIDKNYNEIYINPNSPPNVNLVVYYPGLGGPKKTVADGLRNAMASTSNPPDYCTIIAKNWQDPSHVLDRATNILNANNFNVNSLFTSGNSASGGVALSRTNEYLRNHPELIGRTTISMNDAYNMENKYRFDVLIKNKIPIIFIAPNSKPGRAMQWTTPATKNGLNVFLVKTKDENHNDIAQYCFANRIPDYVLGLSNEVGHLGGSKDPQYTVYKYNRETGEYEKVPLDEIQLNTVVRPENIEIFDPSTYVVGENFKITLENLDATSNFRDLGGINDVSFTLPSNLANSEQIKSDIDFIQTAINAIRNQVRGSGFLGSVSIPSSRGYNGIPGCIGVYIDKYYDYVGDLMDLVVAETDAIASAGQVMIDMDADLAERGAALGTVTETPYDPKVRDKKYKERDSKEELTTEVPLEYGDVPDKGYYGGHPSGHSSKEKFDLKGYKKYKRSDGSQLLIKTENGKVVDVMFKYKYNSESQAKYMCDKLKDQYKKDHIVSKTEQDGKYVYVVLKENTYKGKTIESIKKQYL